MTGNTSLRTLIKAGCMGAALTLAAGCTSGAGSAKATGRPAADASAAAPAMTIAKALNSIPDTDWDENFIAFGATARMAALDRADKAQPYMMVYGLVDQLIPLYGGTEGESEELSVLGFDLLKAPFTVSVTSGTKPVSSATTLFGSFDTTSIGAKLTAAGFTRTGSKGGATTWTYKSRAAAPEFPMTAADDSVPEAISVSPTRIVFGAAASLVAAIAAPATEPLSRNAGVAALAGCLGPATTGLIGGLYQQPNVAGPIRAALGFTAGSGGPTTLEVCVAAASPAAAQAMKSRWISGVATGTDSRSDQAWSSIIADPQAAVDQGSNVVRLSADLVSATPSGMLDQYLSGSIATLILPPSA